MIAVSVGASTHVGNVRKNNQDAVLAASPLFAVADGMGGVAGGEVASALAVERLNVFGGATAVEPSSVLAAVQAANTAVFERRRADPSVAEMGTTVAGVALTRHEGSDALLVFNVGDSRIYRAQGAALEQLSTDHSVVEELIEAGRITTEQAATHPERNVVTRVIGGEPTVQIDSWILVPSVGDRFIICSDGLSGELDDDRIAAVVADVMQADALADKLVATALAGRCRDNVSVVVVDVVGVGSTDDVADEDTDPRLLADQRG